MRTVEPNGVGLREIELSPDELAQFLKYEQKQLTTTAYGSVAINVGLVLLLNSRYLFDAQLRRHGGSSSLGWLLAAWAFLISCLLVWNLVYLRRGRQELQTITSCTFQLVMLPDTIVPVYKPDPMPRRLRLASRRGIPWALVSLETGSPVEPANLQKKPSTFTIPERYFENDEQRAIYRERVWWAAARQLY